MYVIDLLQHFLMFSKFIGAKFFKYNFSFYISNSVFFLLSCIKFVVIVWLTFLFEIFSEEIT